MDDEFHDDDLRAALQRRADALTGPLETEGALWVVRSRARCRAPDVGPRRPPSPRRRRRPSPSWSAQSSATSGPRCARRRRRVTCR